MTLSTQGRGDCPGTGILSARVFGRSVYGGQEGSGLRARGRRILRSRRRRRFFPSPHLAFRARNVPPIRASSAISAGMLAAPSEGPLQLLADLGLAPSSDVTGRSGASPASDTGVGSVRGVGPGVASLSTPPGASSDWGSGWESPAADS